MNRRERNAVWPQLVASERDLEALVDREIAARPDSHRPNADARRDFDSGSFAERSVEARATGECNMVMLKNGSGREAVLDSPEVAGKLVRGLLTQGQEAGAGFLSEVRLAEAERDVARAEKARGASHASGDLARYYRAIGEVAGDVGAAERASCHHETRLEIAANLFAGAAFKQAGLHLHDSAAQTGTGGAAPFTGTEAEEGGRNVLTGVSRPERAMVAAMTPEVQRRLGLPEPLARLAEAEPALFPEGEKAATLQAFAELADGQASRAIAGRLATMDPERRRGATLVMQETALEMTASGSLEAGESRTLAASRAVLDKMRYREGSRRTDSGDRDAVSARLTAAIGGVARDGTPAAGLVATVAECQERARDLYAGTEIGRDAPAARAGAAARAGPRQAEI